MTNPHIGIGRRHPQLPDPRQLDAVLQMALVGQQILEPPAAFYPRDTRLLVGGVDETGDAEFGAVLVGADHEGVPEAAQGLTGICVRLTMREKPGRR